MSYVLKKISDSHLMICLDNGETAVVSKDSKEAKFWLQKEKEQECEK